MRETFNPQFIIENNILRGFYFSCGFCAEQERGFDSLLNDFKVDDSILGLNGRKINFVPQNCMFFEYTSSGLKRAIILYSKFIDIKNVDELKSYLKNHYYLKTIRNNKEKEWISAAYSDSDFAIYVAGHKNVQMLKEIYQSIQNLDISLGYGNLNDTKNNPFERMGLCFMICSKFSEKEKEELYQDDLDDYNLNQAAKPFLDKLKKAKKPFNVCNPKWSDDKSKLLFYFVPYDTDKDYFGWVSGQDLLDWIKNEGFISNHGLDFKNQNKELMDSLEIEHKKMLGIA